MYVFDLPLLILITSLVYSATRFDQWDQIGWEASRWILRLTGFLGIIAFILFLVSRS